ncbi:zinc finger CCCH domain-containing protein 48-like [Actinidia eriantha]|uniref:zinc finger CCCH domain-containing protein 48-like n=1 Tax=Actinidia eriantha TaxID=165200 RepID=UPI00258BFFA5|nr:zinc finger CCCH domain-containing protein 48-like [Actinidia eriantha]
MFCVQNMGGKTVRRVAQRLQGSVNDKVGGGTVNKVCVYWLSGRCTRNPCRFLHLESPTSKPSKQSQDRRSNTWNRSPSNSVKNSSTSHGGGFETESKIARKTQSTVCQYLLSADCMRGEKCEDLHSWFCGNGLAMVARLDGHNKAVTGIAFPSGSDKLLTGCKDKTVRVWDSNTGQCVRGVNMSGEVGSLICHDPWVFVGLTNAVKAWNIETKEELNLTGPVGQVYAVTSKKGVLFAGTQDGTILAWKSNSQTNCHDLVASMKGHSGGVVSLVGDAKNRLYSGSMDHTIRVWESDTFECIHTLNGHTDVVMSVGLWDVFLLSCSLDGTIKVWAPTEGGGREVCYTHKEGHGVLALGGICDAEAKPILLCSCNDNSVRLYDLPSFAERGRLFTKSEVRTIEKGPSGLFFTGDGMGQVTVWKLAGEASAAASCTLASDKPMSAP